jgi:hypothetical protein
MCPFEILHYLPLGLIAFSVISLFSSSSKLHLSLIVIASSLVGLVAGEHMHTVHFEPMTILDPCYGYVASLIVSSYVLVRNYKAAKKVAAN